MPLWLLIIVCYLQICLLGLIGMGLIFMACAEGQKRITPRINDLLVLMWFAFGIIGFASVAWQIYSYIVDSSAAYYWWLSAPWLVLALMLLTWSLATDTRSLEEQQRWQ